MRVFISYKSEEREFAITLRDKLQKWGHDTWLDVDDIPPGTTHGTRGWDDAIHAGMKACQVVVGVMSRRSLQSPNVLDEWRWALENDRRLFLLWLEDVSSEDIPPSYIRIQFIDFRTDLDKGFSKLRLGMKSPALIVPETEVPGGSRHLGQPIEIYTPPDTDRKQRGRSDLSNREAMLQKVHHNWIVGVLDDALHNVEAFPIELGHATPGAVLKHIDFGDYTLPDTRGIFGMFDDMKRELLILGAPGSGKTILMLQLARDLLTEAQHDETKPIPVVFNLSSWAAKHEAFDRWVVEQLRTTYQIPRKIAEDWIANERLLLLLDGLDEVARGYRGACVDTINRFRSTYQSINMVICSRIDEYEALQQEFQALHVRCAIQLQPLSPEQIAVYTQGRELEGLRSVMESDSELATMAATPFLLNTMVYSYWNEAEIGLRLEPDQARRDHLLGHYVKMQLAQGAADNHTPPYITRRYLAWLAKHMVESSMTVFHIESIHAAWLPARSLHHLYRWGSGLMTGLIVLLVGIWIDEPLVGLLSGLVVASYVIMNPHIQPVESISWHLNRGGLAGGLIVGLVLGLSGTLYDGPGIELLLGLLGGILFGLSVGFLFGIHTGSSIDTRSFPNQGLRRTAMNALQIALIFGISVGLFAALSGGLATNWTRGPDFALNTGQLAGVLIGLTFGGGQQVSKHIILRFLLARSGVAPLNYARFLDYAVDRRLMRRVGGGYIFIHRELQDYFASLEQPTD